VLIISLIWRFIKNNPFKESCAPKPPSPNNKSKPQTPKPQKSEKKICYKGPIHIYFASQSGTASRFAEDLSQMLFSKNLVNFVHNLNKFHMDQFLLQENVIFILSTHYDGDPPDNCSTLLPHIKDTSHRDNISKKNFCIFGLGDVTYDRFNDFAKKVRKVFMKYKSKEILPMGLGSDHEGNIDIYFDKWKRKCVREWRKQELADFKGNLKMLLKTKAESPKSVQFSDTNKFATSKRFLEEFGFAARNMLKNAKDSRILEVKELRDKPEKYERTLLVTFKLEKENEFISGHNIALFPQNCQEDVDKVVEMFNLNKSQYIMYDVSDTCVKLKTNIPHGTNVNTALKEILDLKGQIKANQIRRILKLNYISESKKSELENLLSNSEELDFISKARFGIIQFLSFYKIELQFKDFLEICDVIKPRIFTICKSSNKSPQKADIVISTKHDKIEDSVFQKVNKTTPISQTWTGLTSQYFINLFEQSQTKEGIQNNNMKYIIQDSSFKVSKFIT
jgi:NADPH-ferrihemoprotein reductase